MCVRSKFEGEIMLRYRAAKSGKSVVVCQSIQFSSKEFW